MQVRWSSERLHELRILEVPGQGIAQGYAIWVEVASQRLFGVWAQMVNLRSPSHKPFSGRGRRSEWEVGKMTPEQQIVSNIVDDCLVILNNYLWELSYAERKALRRTAQSRIVNLSLGPMK